MDQNEIRKNWIKWLILEVLLTGGFWFAETRLPPLLPGVLPSLYRHTGWAGLHAILQMILFFRIFIPLTKAGLIRIYPGMDPKIGARAVLFSFMPVTLIPFLAFLWLAKPRAEGTRPPALIRYFWAAPLLVYFLIGLPTIYNLSLDKPLLKPSTLQGITELTLNPTASYLAVLGTSVDEASDVKARFKAHPEQYQKPSDRLAVYRQAASHNTTVSILYLAIEVMAVSQQMKAIPKEADPDAKAGLSLDLMEGMVGVLESKKNGPGFLSDFSPLSIAGVGSVELFLLMAIEKVTQSKFDANLRKTLANAFANLKKKSDSGKLKPETLARMEELKKRALTLYPDFESAGAVATEDESDSVNEKSDS